MNTRQPLNDKTYRDYGEEYEEYYYEEESEVSKPKTITLYGFIICVCVGCIWFFVIYLPDYFIPQARDLKGIIKVTDLGVSLKPLSESRVKQLELSDIQDKGSKYDIYNDNYSESDSDVDIGEYREYGSDEDDVEIDSNRAVERIILIGDIHGHYIELRKLLRKLDFNRKTDHILMLGDFIAKGRDSMKVLEYAIDNRLDCIFGNHELYVLQNYAQLHRLDEPQFIKEVGSSSVDIRSLFNNDPEYLLAKTLQPHHVEYINSCLVIKRLGKVPLHKSSEKGGVKYTNGVAVHGGLRWDIPFEEQDSQKCLEMRSYIGPHYNVSTDDPFEKNAISWSKIWNKKQKKKSTNDAYVAYYGHDARRGLKLKKFSKGLDTGCYKGGRLTAMVIWNEKVKSSNDKGYILHKEKLVSVSC